MNFSRYTDPGEYADLYSDLPDDIDELLAIIKCQLIHPFGDLPMYKDRIPEERHYEDRSYPTVKAILAGLVSHNPKGLAAERLPEQRLVVTCRYHAVLLASILKYKGIPARVRYGFAPYLVPDLHICHVICEIWNSTDQRWILADPDRKLNDIPVTEFDFSAETWLANKNGAIDSQKYGVESEWGFYPILDSLCHDYASILGREHDYWECPPVSANPKITLDDMPEEHIEVLDHIALLLNNPDHNIQELEAIYNEHEYLQY